MIKIFKTVLRNNPYLLFNFSETWPRKSLKFSENLVWKNILYNSLYIPGHVYKRENSLKCMQPILQSSYGDAPVMDTCIYISLPL